MSSVVKNPLILNSANYIYNWFLTMNNQNEKLIEKNNMYEMVESDEYILNSIVKTKDNNEHYKKIEERLENAKVRFDG